MSFNSQDLKDQLWDTLKSIKNKKMTPVQANAVATQAREIMRIVKTELQVASLCGVKPNKTSVLFLGQDPRKDVL